MKKTILTIAAAAIATSAFGVPDLSIANKIGYAFPGTATIDGAIGAGEWDSAVNSPNAIGTYIPNGTNFTPPSNAADLSGQWWAMWDNDALYLLIEVQDDTFPVLSSTDQNHHDSFEIYTSPGYTRNFGEWANPGYDELSDAQFIFKFDQSATASTLHGYYSFGGNGAAASASIQSVTTVTETGYLVEVKMPWAAILGNTDTITFDGGIFYDGPYADIYGSERNFLGFDVHLQDNDAGAARETKVAWCGGFETEFENRIGDFAWADTQVFGTLVLETGTPCDVTDVVFTNTYWQVLTGDFVNFVTGKQYDGYTNFSGFLYVDFCPFVYNFETNNWWYIYETGATAEEFFAYDFASSTWKFVFQGFVLDL